MSYVIIDGKSLTGFRAPGGNQRGMYEPTPGLRGTQRGHYAPSRGRPGGDGLQGPLTITIDHLGQQRLNTLERGHYSLVGGLGAAAINDVQARQQIESLFVGTTSQWVTLLNQALSDIPFVDAATGFFLGPAGLVISAFEMNQARKIITDNRDALKNSRNNLFSDSVDNFGIAVIRDTSIPLTEVAQRVRDFLASYLANLQQSMEIAQQIAKMSSMRGHLQLFEDAVITVLQKAGAAIGKAATTLLTALPPGVLFIGGIAVFAYLAHALK